MAVWLTATTIAMALAAQSPREVMARAVEDFRAGRIEQAIAAQDRYAGVGGYMHDVARVHMKHD